MKIEVDYKNNYNVFLNNQYLNTLDLLNKDEIISYVKDFITINKKKMNLNGFYKVIVFSNKNIGLFLNIVKMEDNYYSNNIDLRVIVNTNSDIYFKTSDFFVIKDCSNIRYYNGNYYCLIDDLCGSIFNYCELGDFIYGEEVNLIVNKSIFL